MNEQERDKQFADANIIREEIIMKACKELQEDLLAYSDDKILNSKTRNVRIKLTVI